MWYLNLVAHEMKIIREVTESELEFYKKTSLELREYENNIERFDRVNRNFELLKLTISTFEKKSIRECIRDLRNAVANFLYSFNECLDHWKTYISRKYGKTSDYYKRYEALTHEAFDQHDEYAITYALRNYQHIENAVHGFNVRYDKPAFIYSKRDDYLKEDCFTKPVREALSRQAETIDLFAVFTVARNALEKINMNLLFFPLTPEVKKHAIQALNLHQELCPNGGGLILADFTNYEGKIISPEKLTEYNKRGKETGLDYLDEIPYGLCALIAMWDDSEPKKT